MENTTETREGEVKVNVVWQFAARHTATGTHVPCVISQCHLPPSDISDLTPAEAGTRLSDLGGMQS